ncbi:MAG: DUF4386 domain-containing protein [Tannerella sp.]|jgi:hypothetical protein|nr:DUF4386 domain-containing protein [Tannerella sp.]
MASNNQDKTARIAGIWYLGMIVTMAFGWMYVDAALFVPGDAAATAANILASEQLLRLGFVSSCVGMICFLMVANTLYKLFEPVDRNLSRLIVVFVAVDVAVMFINALFKFAPVLFLNGTGYLSAFDTAQLHALAMIFLDLYEHGQWMLAIFSGLWLLPVGLLILKSTLIPKVIGILAIISTVFYAVQFFTFFLLPDHFGVIEGILDAGSTIGEIPLPLWLLIMGAKDRKPASEIIKTKR